MRSPKVLEKMATSTLAMTNGVCRFDVLAIDDEEVKWFTAFLRGKHNTKLVGIHRGRPGDELPMMGLVSFADGPLNPNPSPARKRTPQLTEDGY